METKGQLLWVLTAFLKHFFTRTSLKSAKILGFAYLEIQKLSKNLKNPNRRSDQGCNIRSSKTARLRIRGLGSVAKNQRFLLN